MGYQFRFFNPLTKQLLEDDNAAPVVLTADSRDGRARKARDGTTRVQSRSRSKSAGTVSRGRNSRPANRQKKAAMAREPVRLSQPVAVVVGPACGQCGGERGDLLTCHKCACVFHVRCVELPLRPSAITQRWTCGKCAASPSSERAARKPGRKVAIAKRVRPSKSAVRKTVKRT